MSLFIGKGILYGLDAEKLLLKKASSNRQILIIPRFVKYGLEHNYKDVKFSFGPEFDINPESLEGNNEYVFPENAKLIKTGTNSYQIKETKNIRERCIYAILREYTCIGHDLFIPVSSKKNIKVLNCISFYPVEPDYGEYEAIVYLVKITLRNDESLLIYSGNNVYPFEKHMAFFRKNHCYAVEPNLKTLLFPGKDFVCLKDLISK